MIKVIKRDGRKVDFSINRIINAITKAMEQTEKGIDKQIADKIATDIKNINKGSMKVEEIQDIIEEQLLNSDRKDVAKEYIRYRKERTLKREEQSELFKKVIGLIEGTDKGITDENANKDAKIIPVKRDLLAGIIARYYGLNHMLPKRVKNAHINGDGHFHDLDYSPLLSSFNCMLVDIGYMFKHGFHIGNTEIETPKSFMTACTVTTQIIAHVASSIYGGTTVNEIDKVLSPYVKTSFKKHFMTGLYWINNETLNDDFEDKYGEINHDNIKIQKKFPKVHKYATELTKKEVYDGCQTIEYQINSLYTSNGQTPFFTLGFGRGISWEETLIQENILKVRINGLGKAKKTAIFPKLVFAVEEGINKNPTDKNYNIKQLAIKCATLRMYPDILNVPMVIKNTGSFKNPMGCRSFLSPWYDENGTLIHDGRNNCGVYTINLPRLGIRSNHSIEYFYKLLDEQLEIAYEALMYRLHRFDSVRAKEAPILYCEGAMGVKLNPEDNVSKLFKNGRASISLGYIGVHETILAIFGKHIYDDENLKSEGIKLVKYLHDKCNEWKEKTGYGFSVYSTPAESLCYRFCEIDKKDFGILKGITDKDYYMNSFHLDVTKQVSSFDKIDFEAPYPPLANGGHICYTEFPSLVNNPQALEDVWDYSYDKTDYQGTNTPIDKCFECGFEGEFDATDKGFICPNCGNDNPQTSNVTRRVCGYLGNPNDRKPNKGKLEETQQRVKHM